MLKMPQIQRENILKRPIAWLETHVCIAKNLQNFPLMIFQNVFGFRHMGVI